MIEIKQTIPVTNRNTSSVQFLTFNDQNKIIYNGYCKLKGNTLSKYLHIDPLDEEIKPKSVSFDSNFIKEKHILCILSESKIHDLVLIFQHEKLCQQFLTSINKYRNPSNDLSTEKIVIQDKFFIPAFQQLCDPNIAKILTDLFQLYNQQEKQSFITFLKESGFYDTVKSILPFENYLTHDSGTTLNTRKRRHNETGQCTNNAPMNKRDNELCLKEKNEMKEKLILLIDIVEIVFPPRGPGKLPKPAEALKNSLKYALSEHYGLGKVYVDDWWTRTRNARNNRRAKNSKKDKNFQEATAEEDRAFVENCIKEFGEKVLKIKKSEAPKPEKSPQKKNVPSSSSSSKPPIVLSKKAENATKTDKVHDSSIKSARIEKEMEEADLLVAVAEKGLEVTAWQVFAHFGEKYLEHNFCRDCDCRKPVKKDSKCTQNPELEKIEDDIKRQQEQFLNIIDAMVKKRSTEKKEGQENKEEKKKDEKAAAKNKGKKPQKKKSKN